jgi:predicted nuclease of predicted toxin-antitoxin system
MVMAKIFFYFDENIQAALADALNTRGIDVLTTHKAGNVGAEDLHQLAYAADKGEPFFLTINVILPCSITSG